MLLGMTALFPSAAAPSLKLVDWKRNDIFTYEFTGAGADSWVGIYYASETPGADTPLFSGNPPEAKPMALTP